MCDSDVQPPRTIFPSGWTTSPVACEMPDLRPRDAVIAEARIEVAGRRASLAEHEQHREQPNIRRGHAVPRIDPRASNDDRGA